MREKRALIDWLRFTTDQPFQVELFLTHFGLIANETTAIGFYNTALEFGGAPGILGRVDWHTQEPRQKVMFTFTGVDLDGWRKLERVPSLIAWAISQRATFTRVDFAIDILDAGAKVETIAALVKRGRAHTNAKTHSIITGQTEGKRGATLYVGSRQSDKFLRVYNKAAEQGIAGDWIRVELECKGDYARAIAPHLLSDGVEFGIGQIRQFCDFPGVDWWQFALDDGGWTDVKVDRTPGDRRKWQDTVLFGMTLDALDENADFAARLVIYLDKGGYIDRYR